MWPNYIVLLLSCKLCISIHEGNSCQFLIKCRPPRCMHLNRDESHGQSEMKFSCLVLRSVYFDECEAIAPSLLMNLCFSWFFYILLLKILYLKHALNTYISRACHHLFFTDDVKLVASRRLYHELRSSIQQAVSLIRRWFLP